MVRSSLASSRKRPDQILLLFRDAGRFLFLEKGSVALVDVFISSVLNFLDVSAEYNPAGRAVDRLPVSSEEMFPQSGPVSELATRAIVVLDWVFDEKEAV